MKPKQNDTVKFTDRFLNGSPYNWVPSLKNVELLVAKLKLKTMIPCKVFTIFIIANNHMYKVDINETGHFVNNSNQVTNYLVFEPFHKVDSSQKVIESVPAWVPDSPRQSTPVTEEEANSTCINCGAPALDLAFRIKCTNPNCINYK